MRQVPLFATVEIREGAAVSTQIMGTQPLSSHPTTPKQHVFLGGPWISHDGTPNPVAHHPSPRPQQKLVRKAHESPGHHGPWAHVGEDWHSEILQQKVFGRQQEVQVLRQKLTKLQDPQGSQEGQYSAGVQATGRFHLQICRRGTAYPTKKVLAVLVLLENAGDVSVAYTRRIGR